MDSVVILKAWVRTMAAVTLGNLGPNKDQLSIWRRSGATVAYQVKQLTHRLIEAFEPLCVDAMPGIVHGHLLGVHEESAYIAADRSAGKLRHPLIVTLPSSRVNRRVGYPSLLVNSGSAGSLRDHRRLAVGLSMLILYGPGNLEPRSYGPPWSCAPRT